MRKSFVRFKIIFFFKLSNTFTWVMHIKVPYNLLLMSYRWSLMGRCCPPTGMRSDRRRWKGTLLMGWRWRNGSIREAHPIYNTLVTYTKLLFVMLDKCLALLFFFLSLLFYLVFIVVCESVNIEILLLECGNQSSNSHSTRHVTCDNVMKATEDSFVGSMKSYFKL